MNSGCRRLSSFYIGVPSPWNTAVRPIIDNLVKTKSFIPTLLGICLAFSLLNAAATDASAQNVVVTYQGRVTDNGTNFTGAGQFQFALVTSTNTSQTATATANAPSGGFITVINVVSGGSGYASAPAVTITGGGGSGATATATVSGGSVTAITINNPGSGYTSTPLVTLAPPPPNTAYTTHWSNDGTSVAGSEPTAFVSVSVAGGLFTVGLGDTTLPGMDALPAALFAQPNLKLRIWFNDGVNGFAALEPAQPLTPAPYALNAQGINGGLSISQNTNGAPNVIGGSSVNYVGSGVVGATIGGGGAADYFGTPFTNSVTADFGTVSGGYGNTASGKNATVGGGRLNTASGDHATVGGGYDNAASGAGATVGGGHFNTASGPDATAGGGYGNTASGYIATVGGGWGNQATNSNATVPGGMYNVAGGQYSFAAGRQAQAIHDGDFVWADSQDAAFPSTAINQFLIRAAGGVGINTNNPGATLDVNGSLRVGAGTTVFKNLQGGIAQMATGSDTVRTNFTFTFPTAFGATPKVLVSASSDNAVPVDDTFVVSVRAVTGTNCTVNIVRVDNPSGWSQHVKINWLAWE